MRRPRVPKFPKGEWSWLVVNSSGGKDSQTALRVAVEAATAAGFPRDRIVVSHQCLGKMEWAGTLELVKQQAAAYGLRLEVVRYRDREGQEISLPDYVRKRGKWPGSATRWCTSEFKRGPGGRVLTKLSGEAPGNILQVFGYRRQESQARSKKQVLVENARFSRDTRRVWDWSPILDWRVEHVWGSILESGVPSAHSYKVGMPRHSCIFCILATRSALLVAGTHNPELLDELCEIEIETGHTFQPSLSLVDLREAIRGGEKPPTAVQDWTK